MNNLLLNVPHLLTATVQLICAAVAGTVLGFPFRYRPGGLRTHALVTVGTALFCMLGMDIAARFSVDLSRIIQGVIQGIGFIGAAAVIKQGGYIVGVNTAASILVASAIGCFIGTGYALYGLLLAPLVMGLNVGLRILEQRIERQPAVEQEDKK